MRILGFRNERSLLKQIERERLKGAPIIADRVSGGFYRTVKRGKLIAAYKRYLSILSIESRKATVLRKILNVPDGQSMIDESGGD